MKTTINFKYVSSEQKTSAKGKIYYNVCILQGVDFEKVYYPYETIKEVETLTDCKGTLEIKKDKFGVHLTLMDFEEVK